MKSIDQLIDELIQREGDYVNHPADRGGPTRWGITQEVARGTGYAGDMREFPRSTAAELYKRTYWFRPGFDLVAKRAPRLAEELFDTGVNMGPLTAAKFLQRALNALNNRGKDFLDIAVDGKLGGQSDAALGAFLYKRRAPGGEDVLLKAVECLQGARYLDLAENDEKQEAFTYGWLANRIGNVG